MTELYLITPSVFDLAEMQHSLHDALQGGKVAYVQLRMKDADVQEVKEAAFALKPLVHAVGAKFIMNDYVELAKEIQADGVHLGDEDKSVADARAMLGSHAIIGASCYGSQERAEEAVIQGADYVAFGQFYETATKPPKGRPTPEILSKWKQKSAIPTVAIGGIKPENCAPIVKAGADYMAVVSGVWQYPWGAKRALEAYHYAIAENSI